MDRAYAWVTTDSAFAGVCYSWEIQRVSWTEDTRSAKLWPFFRCPRSFFSRLLVRTQEVGDPAVSASFCQELLQIVSSSALDSHFPLDLVSSGSGQGRLQHQVSIARKMSAMVLSVTGIPCGFVHFGPKRRHASKHSTKRLLQAFKGSVPSWPPAQHPSY